MMSRYIAQEVYAELSERETFDAFDVVKYAGAFMQLSYVSGSPHSIEKYWARSGDRRSEEEMHYDTQQSILFLRGECGWIEYGLSDILNFYPEEGFQTWRVGFNNVPVQQNHTATEVKINGRWVFFDATFGVYMKDREGNLLDLDYDPAAFDVLTFQESRIDKSERSPTSISFTTAYGSMGGILRLRALNSAENVLIQTVDIRVEDAAPEPVAAPRPIIDVTSIDFVNILPDGSSTWSNTAEITEDAGTFTFTDNTDDTYQVASWVFQDFEPTDFEGYSIFRFGYKLADGTQIKNDVRLNIPRQEALMVRGEGTINLKDQGGTLDLIAKFPLPSGFVDPYIEIYPASANAAGEETAEVMTSITLHKLSLGTIN